MDKVKMNIAAHISKDGVNPNLKYEATGNPANTFANSVAHIVTCIGTFIEKDLKWCILAYFARDVVKAYINSNHPSAPAPSK